MIFSSVSIIVLFIITLFCAVAGNTYKAVYIKRNVKNTSEFFLLNGFISLFCAVALAILGGFDFNTSWYSVIAGLIFGAVTMAFLITNSMAVRIGPYGYTTLIVSMSTAVTAVSGAIFWGEILTLTKIAGIILMCTCFFFTINTDKEAGKKTNLKWLILSIACLIFNAAIGLIQKVHQNTEHKNELTPFLVTAFIAAALVTFGIYAITFIKEKRNKTFVNNTEEPVIRARTFRLIAMTLICGICTAATFAINLYLSGVADSSVFFPIVNGVPLMLSLVISFLFFKERLTKKQIAGLIIGIASVVCLIV